MVDPVTGNFVLTRRPRNAEQPVATLHDFHSRLLVDGHLNLQRPLPEASSGHSRSAHALSMAEAPTQLGGVGSDRGDYVEEQVLVVVKTYPNPRLTFAMSTTR